MRFSPFFQVPSMSTIGRTGKPWRNLSNVQLQNTSTISWPGSRISWTTRLCFPAKSVRKCDLYFCEIIHVLNIYFIIFFLSPGVPFPKNFMQIAKTILKRLFRVYAHIYHQHFREVVSLGEEAHLNTSFKHFIYFVQVGSQKKNLP